MVSASYVIDIYRRRVRTGLTRIPVVGSCNGTQHPDRTIPQQDHHPHQAREVCSGAGGGAEDVVS